MYVNNMDEDKMIKFICSLGIHRYTKIVEEIATLINKTACSCLGMESNRAWMTETGNSFHAVSSLCYFSSTVFAGEV